MALTDSLGSDGSIGTSQHGEPMRRRQGRGKKRSGVKGGENPKQVAGKGERRGQSGGCGWMVYVVVLVVVAGVSAGYAVLVWDLAREYATTNVPTDPKIRHIGNLWEAFFAWATTEETAVGERGISGQRLTYVESWVAMVAHWIGGGALMFLGPLQFIPYVRRRVIALHRWSGYAYYAAAALSLFGSLGMYARHSIKTEMYNGYVFSLPLFLLALLSLRANVKALWSIITRGRKGMRAHMVNNAMGFATFLTAPWLRVLWVFFPPLLRALGAKQAVWEDMMVINVLSTSWVLTPMILLAAVYLCSEPLFYSSPRLQAWRLSASGFALSLAAACLSAAFVFYQSFFRFSSKTNVLWEMLIGSPASEVAEELRQARQMYVTGFAEAGTTNPLRSLLMGMGFTSPEPLAYAFLGFVTFALLLSPILLRQVTHGGGYALVLSVYLLAMAGVSASSIALEVLSDGMGFAGCFQTSIWLSVLAAWAFCALALCYFTFWDVDRRRARVWAVYTASTLVGYVLTCFVLTVAFSWLLDVTFVDAHLTAGMLAASLPFILSFSFVGKAGKRT